ncbi:MAG: DNA polymerase III subunit alpha [Phycisphaerales bacterium]|nr:MAG: DNA polymerase III subunit alpha [Phycisphaerales bacterium]
MADECFCHLHNHTHYSLLDGATRIKPLVRRAKEMGMKAVAITDHGNMFGAVEFYRAAVAAGIKPIIGCEAYMAPGHRAERDARDMSEASHHLLLLAMDQTGYVNLMRLCSIAYREGFYYRPRIDREVLAEHSAGLICTSACLGGEMAQALVRGNRAAAEEIAKAYASIFGPDRFYIEIQDHGLAEQKMINPELADTARRLGVGLIATNDVHYLEHDDVEAHDVLCCISTGKLVSDEDRFRFDSDQFYLKSPAEMRKLFADYPEAIENTGRVADMCNVELDFATRHAPVFHPPEKRTPDEYLRELVYRGAEERYGQVGDELRERIDYELEVIGGKGFSSYFLIVWDFVNYARSRGIPCSARGSACSSVVAYCLHLSQPDPIRYGLYFERFMDPDRDEMPDIDIDLCQDGRAEVIDYVREKYGHVAQIITYGTLKARAAVKDVCRVMGIGFEESNQLTKLIPAALNMTLDKALAGEPRLRELSKSDERIAKVIDISRKLEGLARHAGIHAAGVVVADQPLDNFLPLYKPPGEDQIVTQYDGNTVEKVGLLKMDFLGLRTLTTLERGRRLVRQHHGVDIDLSKLDLTDQKVYEVFASGQTRGVFQFESGGMREVIKRMRPNRIEDLIAANALYRPGPMVNIDAYVARKHGEPWSTPHPIMTEMLDETFGIMVYQEQVSRVVNRLGDIELKRAFRLAKAISKKKSQMIEAEREPFLQGAEKNGVSRQVANEIYDDILRFGGYAFNKAHSTGYALIAFQTAYLKAYYPVEFMAALLSLEKGDSDKVAEYIEECRRMEIPVRPPDVNSSDADFTVVYEERGGRSVGVIRFGLAAIKGVGEKAVAAVTEARAEGGRFRSVFDFCERVNLVAVNRGCLEALIKSGAFDSTGAMRKALMNVVDRALELGQSVQADKRAGQMSLFGGPATDDAAPSPEPSIGNEEWTEAEMLAHEKAALGFYVTSHPLAQHVDALQRFATAQISGLAEYQDGTEVTIGGMITKVRTVITRQGKNAGSKMGIVTVEDLSSAMEAVVFARDLERFRHLIAPEQVVFMTGRVDRKREEPSLRVVEMISMEEAPARLAGSVLIRVRAAGTTREQLDRLRELVAEHSGDTPLFLEVLTTKNMRVTIRCSNAGVAASREFVAEAHDLFGEQGVQILPPAGARRRFRTNVWRGAAPRNSGRPQETVAT